MILASITGTSQRGTYPKFSDLLCRIPNTKTFSKLDAKTRPICNPKVRPRTPSNFCFRAVQNLFRDFFLSRPKLRPKSVQKKKQNNLLLKNFGQILDWFLDCLFSFRISLRIFVPKILDRNFVQFFLDWNFVQKFWDWNVVHIFHPKDASENPFGWLQIIFFGSGASNSMSSRSPNRFFVNLFALPIKRNIVKWEGPTWHSLGRINAN